MTRKNWSATGSFLKDDRPRALDLLGLREPARLQHLREQEPGRPRARRATSICVTAWRAPTTARWPTSAASTGACSRPATCRCATSRARAPRPRRRSRLGCKALLIPSACPKGHSPSHVALDAVWAVAQEAGAPIVLHVGGGGQLLDPDYFENGLPPVPDFHGGAENFRSVDYMAIPYPVMQTLAHDDHRRRVRALPAADVRRDRAGRVVAAGLDAHARLGARGVPQERGAAARAVAAARASTCAARSA